jgi:hypothetical protein
MVGLLNILSKEVTEREDTDKRMVINLYKHVIEQIAVVNHLSFLLVSLESKVKILENSKCLIDQKPRHYECVTE